MQECVTKVKRKTSKKSGAKAVIFSVLFFFIIFLVTAILVVSKRSNLCFSVRSFHIVYAGKDKTEELVLDLQKQIKDLGGAGVIFEKNTEFLVAVSVCNDGGDAKDVARGLQASFEGAGVTEIVCKGIPRKKQNFIKENVAYFELFKQLFALSKDYEGLCYDFTGGKISEGRFMSSLFERRLLLEELFERCDEENLPELGAILHFAKFTLEKIDALTNKFYVSKTKESLCYEFFVEFCLKYCEMCDNLQ